MLALRIILLDTSDNSTTIHIKVDSSYLQKDKHLRLFLFEQLISATYTNAFVEKEINQYGLLTDVRIKFDSINDLVHFKLINATSILG